MTTSLLALLHAVATAFILAWDVWMTGQIGRSRSVPRAFIALTGLGGLLLVPGAIVAMATSSLLYGRALSTVAWLWPATLLVLAVQAWYATVRGLVSPPLGVPIAVYNSLIAGAAIVKYTVFLGVEPPDPALVLVAAQYGALAVTASPAALASPLFLYVPIVSPAFPARYRASVAVRIAIAAVAAVWGGVILGRIWPGTAAIQSYDRYAESRLRERPQADFAIGVKLFPDLDAGPPPLSIRSDLALVDTLDADVVAITLMPEGTRAATLDSVARVLEDMRRDSTLLVVMLGSPPPRLTPGAMHDWDEGARIDAVRRVVRRLRPDYLIPIVEPYGRAAASYGVLPLATWTRYLTRAAEEANTLWPRTKIGVGVARYTARDSALFAWAAAPDSPLDAIGFSITPSAQGARGLDADMYAADRFLRATRSAKEHWVWNAGSYPAVHGEASQQRALWGVLAWATSRPTIRGLIVGEAGDYETTTGLRAANRRLRPGTREVARAITALRESRE